ncbi:MAG: DUF3459 domain-containing protein [Alphaproteobacteria bacterium]|nr:MAG: DUF3459 domain-containing protein [Alphaproteobacteria bacterium]
MQADGQQLEKHTKTNAEWWRGAVIYQVYPRSFADSNGDGVGDLKGITAKLDHIASLGVDAVWLSPFFTSPMKDFGYDVADFCGVDPIFGTLDDFDELLARAHGLGLKVIIDQVFSHTSDQHAWFQESREGKDNPKADWYTWVDPKADGSPPNNWLSVFMGPAWTWDARRKQYYLHNFLSSQPDLNVHNPEVQDALIGAARFWLDRGVDGFRLDAVNFYMHDLDLRDNPPMPGREGCKPFDMQDHVYNQSHPAILTFLERLRGLMDRYPGRFAVAEIGGDRSLEESIEYTEGDKRLQTAYSFVFLEADTLSVPVIRNAVEAWPDHAGAGWPSYTFSNHDRPRAVSRWARSDAEEADPRFAVFLNSLLCSLRGSICLYQGEEVGLPQARVPYERLVDPEAIANWPQTLGRDGTRTPIPWQSGMPHAGFSEVEPWLPVDNRHHDYAIAEHEKNPASPLHALRKFLAFRKGEPALLTGSITFLEAPEPVLTFVREQDGRRLLCVFNLGTETASYTGPEAELLYSVNDATPGGSLPPISGYIARLK